MLSSFGGSSRVFSFPLSEAKRRERVAILGHLWADHHFQAGRICQSQGSSGSFENAPEGPPYVLRLCSLRGSAASRRRWVAPWKPASSASSSSWKPQGLAHRTTACPAVTGLRFVAEPEWYPHVPRISAQTVPIMKRILLRFPPPAPQINSENVASVAGGRGEGTASPVVFPGPQVGLC